MELNERQSEDGRNTDLRNSVRPLVRPASYGDSGLLAGRGIGGEDGVLVFLDDERRISSRISMTTEVMDHLE